MGASASYYSPHVRLEPLERRLLLSSGTSSLQPAQSNSASTSVVSTHWQDIAGTPNNPNNSFLTQMLDCALSAHNSTFGAASSLMTGAINSALGTLPRTIDASADITYSIAIEGEVSAGLPGVSEQLGSLATGYNLTYEGSDQDWKLSRFLKLSLEGLDASAEYYVKFDSPLSLGSTDWLTFGVDVAVEPNVSLEGQVGQLFRIGGSLSASADLTLKAETNLQVGEFLAQYAHESSLSQGLADVFIPYYHQSWWSDLLYGVASFVPEIPLNLMLDLSRTDTPLGILAHSGHVNISSESGYSLDAGGWVGLGGEVGMGINVGAQLKVGVNVTAGASVAVPIASFENWTPVAPDLASPAVLSYQHSADPSTSVSVCFNKALDQTSLRGNVQVSGSTTGVHQCLPSFDSNTNTLLIQPTTPFSYNETVTTTLGTGLRDILGNTLPAPVTCTFQTCQRPILPSRALLSNVSVSSADLGLGDPFTVTGTFGYDTGQPVTAGTAIITLAGVSYTASITNGVFSRTINAPASQGAQAIVVSAAESLHGWSDSTTLSINVQPFENASIHISQDEYTDHSGTPWPLDETAYFRQDDDRVYATVEFSNVRTEQIVSIAFFDPDGNECGSAYIADVPTSAYWNVYAYTCISGYYPAYHPGAWSVTIRTRPIGGGWKVLGREPFDIGYEFAGHEMAKNVSNNDPVTPTNVFYQNDAKAVTWMKTLDVSNPYNVEWQFYQPNGSLYNTFCWTTADPGSGSYYANYNCWGWINIAGNAAASATGQWHVDVSLEDPSGNYNKVYTDYFQILESPAVAPTAFVTPSTAHPMETQPVSLNISASDNTTLLNATLFWDDGTIHSKQYSNLYAASLHDAVAIGSYAAGSQISYWLDATDTSGNITETPHGLVIVQPETVSRPRSPSGTALAALSKQITFTTGGAVTTLGSAVEYEYDWGDGTQSNWGDLSRSHAWNSAGTYSVRVRARSECDTNSISEWSDTSVVTALLPPTVVASAIDDGTEQRALVRSLSVSLSGCVALSGVALQKAIITNATTGAVVDPSQYTVSYDTASQVATWMFSGYPGGSLPDGNYVLSLSSASVIDVAGDLLDGNADGQGGDAYTLGFFRLDGDANGDRSVDVIDLGILAKYYDTASDATPAMGDFNGDGAVDVIDLGILAKNYDHVLALPGGPSLAIVDSSGDATDRTVAMASTQIGGTSPVQKFTLTNAGTLPLNITGLAIGGANPSDFAVTVTDCTGSTVTPNTFSVPAGMSYTITVAFLPRAAGSRTATITFATNDPNNGSIVLRTAGTGVAAADLTSYTDDFSTDTTGSYDVAYWPYASSQGAAVSVQYDPPGARAILTAQGGYGWTLMTKHGAPLIQSGQDFDFAADVTVLHEFVGALYIGDARGTNAGTYARLRIDTYQAGDRRLGLDVVVDGKSVESEIAAHVGNIASLEVKRVGGVFSFYCDGQLVWQESISALDPLTLTYGVENCISSGPSGLLAQTAVDNWHFACGLSAHIIGSASLPQSPRWKDLAISPDGSTLYVTTRVSGDTTAGKVYAVNTGTMTVGGFVSTGYDPIGVAISPDGAVGYATNTVSGHSATEFNALTMAKVGDVSTGTDSAGVVFSPDGSTVYTVNNWSAMISVIHVATNANVESISGIDSGGLDLAITPDGQYLYATGRTGNIYKVSTGSKSVVSTIAATFAGDGYIKMMADGSRFLLSDGGNALRVYSTGSDSQTGSVPLGSQVAGLGVSQDGTLVAVALPDANEVVVLSTTTYQPLATIAVAGYPLGVAFSPDGSRLYVSSRDSMTITAIGLYAPAGAMADTFGTGANQFDLDFVTISGSTNPTSGIPAGNDFTFTGVNHDYRMGTFDITNDQWNKFLAAYGTVTGSDGGYYSSSLYTGSNVPVNNVSWYEAAQFVNWLNTSTGHQAAYKFTGTQGTGDYTFATWTPTDAGYDAGNPYRNSNAFYYLPTENEWVQAAYWNSTCLQTYATKDGAVPVEGVDANYNGVQPWNVGSGSQELNATYDMMGNVWQWMESPYYSGDYGAASGRELRGGSYVNSDLDLASSTRIYSVSPICEGINVGFRVASQTTRT